jgi:hypothetical protein
MNAAGAFASFENGLDMGTKSAAWRVDVSGRSDTLTIARRVISFRRISNAAPDLLKIRWKGRLGMLMVRRLFRLHKLPDEFINSHKTISASKAELGSRDT